VLAANGRIGRERSRLMMDIGAARCNDYGATKSNENTLAMQDRSAEFRETSVAPSSRHDRAITMSNTKLRRTSQSTSPSSSTSAASVVPNATHAGDGFTSVHDVRTATRSGVPASGDSWRCLRGAEFGRDHGAQIKSRCGPGGELGECGSFGVAARGIDKAVGVEHELARPGDGHASINARQSETA